MMQHKRFLQVTALVAFLSFSQISLAQIAFVSDRDLGQKPNAGQKPDLGQKQKPNAGQDWDTEIYIMSADGTNPRRLTNHPAKDESPS